MALADEFGAAEVKRDSYPGKGGPADFPVLMPDGRIDSALKLSDTLERLPVAAFDYIFAAPEIRPKAKAWLELNRRAILERGPDDQEANHEEA
jgi:hypothetical protein